MSTLAEDCCDSAATASAAAANGADRVELCGFGVGGTTPADELLRQVRANCTVSLAVMIRPREGNFDYDAAERRAMLRSIESAKAHGAERVVFGVLSRDGSIDRSFAHELVVCARPLEVTFHRAFDQTPDLAESLDILIGLGVDSVLTGGGPGRACDAIAMLRDLTMHAAGRIEIMAGGGIRAGNVGDVVRGAQLTAVHARATTPDTFREMIQALRIVD